MNEKFNLLPIAMKVAASTIGLDLVSVHPLNGPIISKKDIRKKKYRKLFNNEDNDFIDMKNEDNDIQISEHRPIANLFYIDYVYSGKDYKKIQRNKKYKKLFNKDEL